ncbi:TPA: aminoacyltransferase [Streptococcus suis]|nr:aminoacyltransferase [Streptococcus suis]
MELKEISLTDFNNHADMVINRSFMQTEEMAKLLEKRGMDVRFIGLENDGVILVSAIIYAIPMTGGLHLEINSGPIYQDSKNLSLFYRKLKSYAKKRGALQLLVKPYDTYQTFDSEGKATGPEMIERIKDLTENGYRHDGLLTGYPGGEPDWLFVKDLNGLTTENLTQSFSKKGRPLVKKAKSFGIKIRRLERNELHIFKEITSSTSKRREYSDKSLDYYEDFYDSFGQEAEFMVASLNFQEYYKLISEQYSQCQSSIEEIIDFYGEEPNSVKPKKQLKELTNHLQSLEIRRNEAKDFMTKYGQQDIILAGSLFIYTPQEAVYLFSGSYTEFNKFYAPTLLQEHVMQKAIKRGISFYNFLGITGVFDGSDGVLRFKQNFNGYIVRKMGTFRYYPNPIKFKTLQLLKKILRR